MEYIVKVLRTLFFNIDRVVYEGIGKVYDLLLVIARTTILDESFIGEFATRIYMLIGIFMLFKISLSLITYVLNPDEFVDKEKGFASVMKRVVLSLVMLVLVPYGFKELYNLQAIILEDNTLASFVFGTPSAGNNGSTTYQIDTAGEKIKFVLMYTFFQPNYMGLYEDSGNASINACAIPYEYVESGDNAGQVKVDSNDSNIFILNKDCFGDRASDGTYSESLAYADAWSDKDLYQTYAQGVSRQNFYLMFKHDIAMMTKNNTDGLYVVDYMAPLSTAVGVAVLWVLLLFCIDVAVRSVKLAFYQLIAPIPILSYIDPKSGKDGMFSKWIRQVGTTYASLFMRLIALYLAIYVISGVTRSGIRDVVTGERVTDLWVQIFVIIGVLMFAKQLPKVLEDALGIKGTGDFTLNPVKKLESIPGGKILSAPVKAVGNLGKGLALGATVGVGTAAGVGLAGLLSGQGLRGGAMGKAILGAARGEKFGKNFASSYGAGRARKKELDQMAADGVNPWSVTGEKLYNAFHGETRAEHQKSISGKMEAISQTWDEVSKTVTSVDKESKRLKAVSEGIKQAGSSAFKDKYATDSHGNTIIDPTTGQAKIITAAEQYQAALKQAEDALDQRIKQIAAGTERIDDGAGGAAGGDAATARIQNLQGTMNKLIEQVNDEHIQYTYTDASGHQVSREVQITANPNDLKATSKGAQGERNAWESSSSYRGTEDVAKYAGGSKK